ncbi:metallo-beta-lactamase family protein [Sporobacter termitidis DSM 10068]|uniref:Metallo-beta-lactamase family protein n=1 Tax=Sporobacter termitidis DSM 10068 TaxID=1123282 RepID=A0A1M5WVG7_9FIRM|nr:MBL fold metallo-hydrolase [Sporobacter termitidis]SHH91450.1 metallo-beta-lactamase family protein [Sporobacter termitidis DSM 10068]
MKLSFYGADREVTGSCHGVEVRGKKILVDCGMQQGSDNGSKQDFPFDPAAIDYVVMTHAHIDHSGRLPLLVKQGFRNKIYATGATVELLEIMLRDSAHIQEFEAGWKSRKGKRAGNKDTEPLYTMEDAEEVFKYIIPCQYNEEITIDEGVKIRFVDAGHLLGSAYVEMWLTEDSVTKKVVFSGDIGNVGQPIIRDPQYLKEADVVLMESTYGDRNHEVPADYTVDLAKIIDETLGRGGNVIIPSFAIGRTQELLYFIREMKERSLVKSAPNFPVYVDSPLGNAATRIYEGGMEGYLDQETIDVIRSGKKFLAFDDLHISETSEDSKAINFDTVPKVIISSSGMCDAGRIRHHLKHNLWRPECTVVFVGFQAKGTLGRILVDRAASKVMLFGEEIAVKCQILSFRGMSAHADRDGLLKWVGAFDPKPAKVFVVHGEEEVCDIFTDTLKSLGFDAYAPKFTAVYDLMTETLIAEGSAPEQLAEERRRGDRRQADAANRESPVYQRLLSAGTRLLDVIAHNYGGSNKDLAAFTDQIIALAKKWDR